MKGAVFLLAVLAVVALATAVYLQNGAAEHPSAVQADEGHARALLRNAAGAPVGVAKLSQDDGEVLVRVSVHGLPAGFHGFHVHEKGDCTVFVRPTPLPTDPFGSAGGHFKATGQDHPTHKGDMPLLLVNADGAGEARFKTDRFDVADLFDANDSALIIHADPDNYGNIPSARYGATAPIGAVIVAGSKITDQRTRDTGDAGGRIACGVIVGN